MKTTLYLPDDLKGALDDFNGALNNDINYGEAWINRGIVEEQMGDRKDALAACQRGLSIVPSSQLGQDCVRRLAGRG